MKKRQISVLLLVLSLTTLIAIICISTKTSANIENRTTDFHVEVIEPKILEIEIGETANFIVNVSNNGNMNENFSIDINLEAMPEGLPEGWYIDFETMGFNISANDSKQIKVNITNYLKKIPGYYDFYFNVTSKDNESASPKGDVCKVKLMPYYDPELIIDETIKKITPPEEECNFIFRVKNNGTAVDSIYIGIKSVESPLGEHWNGVLPPLEPDDNLLNPGEVSEPYNLNVEIPKLTLAGNYLIELYLNSTKDPTKNKIVNLVVQVKEYYDLTATVKQETVDILPTEDNIAEFIVVITNKGNLNKTFQIVRTGSIPNDWTSDPGGSEVETKEIVPLTSVEFPVNITADREAEKNTYDVSFQITPTDEVSPEIIVTCKVRVVEFYGVELRYNEGPFSGPVKPIEGPDKLYETCFLILVNNIGNVEDTIMLTVFGTPPEWNIGFSDTCGSGGTQTHIIYPQPNEEKYVFLVIAVPTDKSKRKYVKEGSYSITILATSSGNPSKNDTKDITVDVNSVNEVFLDPFIKEVDCDPTINKTAYFKVKVGNYGNFRDKFSIDLRYNESWIKSEILINNTVITQPEWFDVNEEKDVWIKFTIPTIVENYDSLSGRYEVTLEVKPEGDESAKQTTLLKIDIQETYGCEIELIDKYKREIIPDFGTEIKFKFKVTNLGNSETDNAIRIPGIDAIYNLSSSDFNKWDVEFQTKTTSSKDELTLYLDPLKSEEVTLIIDTKPYGGFQDYYGIEIRAYPLGHLGNEATPKTVWLNFTKPIYKLQWTESSQNQNKITEPEEGTKLEYTIYLENLGDVDDKVTVRVEPLDSDIKDWDVKFKLKKGEETDELTGIKINHGDVQSIIVIVRPDETADYDPTPYRIEIVAESELDSSTLDRLEIYTTVKRPDLVILARDITVLEDVKEGDLAQITVKISNGGNANARDVLVQFFSDIDMSDELDKKPITIPANGSAIVTGEWDVEACKYHVTVYADKKNKIREINEENNRATASTTIDVRQDLVVSDIRIYEKCYKGETVIVFVTVWNNGSANVRNIRCVLYAGSKKVDESFTISSIPHGSSGIAEFFWKIPNEKDKNSYSLKAEIPSQYLGYGDPTPRDNKMRKIFPVYEKESPKTEIMNDIFNHAFIIISFIFLLLFLFIYSTQEKKVISVGIIISSCFFVLTLLWILFENIGFAFTFGFITGMFALTILNHEQKNNNLNMLLQKQKAKQTIK